MVPNSKRRLLPRFPFLTADLVAVMESMIAKTITHDAERQLLRDFAWAVLP